MIYFCYGLIQDGNASIQLIDQYQNDVSHALAFKVTRSQPNYTPLGDSGLMC